jgi:hypothetical protein
VARVYSCDAAPPNAISFLLARVRSWFRQNRGDVELLTTVVDPNLGFTAASYRAANWQQWLAVQARPYLYHGSEYVSPRQLRVRFGTSNLDELGAAFPRERFSRSWVKLLDSQIYCCRVDRETEPVAKIPRLHR